MAVYIANVIFDQKQRVLKKDGQTRALEPKVFSLLITLIAANGDIVTRDQLIELVWNKRIVGEGAINRTVSVLRGHFLALTDSNIIETNGRPSRCIYGHRGRLSKRNARVLRNKPWSVISF